MNKLIITFSGSGLSPLQVPREEFVKTTNVLFPDHKKLFFVDEQKYFYHKGITGYSSDIYSTAEFLKQQIVGYDDITFLGTSAGGYASILFGSLLNITRVIAFIPQTNIFGYKDELNSEYTNLNKYINPRTQYYIYGDLNELYNSWHGKKHIDNIFGFPTVTITMLDKIDMKQLRDSGKLNEILLKHIL